LPDLPRNQRRVAELLLERGRLHAYEIKQVLVGEIGHGSVYQALSAIERKGFATTEWQLPTESSEGGGPPRKYYELTALGLEILELERARDEAHARATGLREQRESPG
jgi:DNA-binding PadR family transcriptional regulator